MLLTIQALSLGFIPRSSKNNDQRKFFRPRHQLGEIPLRFNWETPILLSRHNQDVLYMGSNRFHRSLNKADTMMNLSGDLTKGGKPGDVPYGTLTWIAESPLKFGLLYTGSDDGLLHIPGMADTAGPISAMGVYCLLPTGNHNRFCHRIFG